MSLKKDDKNIPIVQANVQKCEELVEQSILKQYFSDTVTDIQYNGTHFFAQDNEIGRYKLDIEIANDEVLSIIKQIANYSLQPFSVQNPVLDVCFGYYRLSAIHPTLARNKNEKVVTFSLRRISPSLKIKDNDESLCPQIIHDLLTILIENYQSIIISGITGSGKTELQKYLVSKMNLSDRIIVIEDSYETYLKEIFPLRDITSWMINSQKNNLNKLIKTAMRHNPDWIIVTETRGSEAFEMIQSISTGHPIITTIHSDSAKNSLLRIIKMFQASIEFNEKSMLQDIAMHLKIGIHIEKRIVNNKIIRSISEIVEYLPTKSGYTTNLLYQNDFDSKIIYGVMTKTLFSKLKNNKQHLQKIKQFLPKEEVHD